MRRRMWVLVVIVLATAAAATLALILRDAEPTAVLFDEVIVRDVADVYPRPVAVAQDWYDGRLDDHHECADMRQALRMFPAGFSAWSSPNGRDSLRTHVDANC